MKCSNLVFLCIALSLILAMSSDVLRTRAQVQRPQVCRKEGETRGCSVGGWPGIETCDGQVWGPCRATGTPPPPPPPSAFDLAWDALDSNGLPQNPRWKWQNFGKPPSPGQCGPNAPWERPCAYASEVTFDTAEICSAAQLFGKGDALYGIAGHANWMPATYVGRLTWDTHSYPCDSLSGITSLSCDDDYNFKLYTPHVDGPNSIPLNNAGLTTVRDYIGCEFDSGETIDHFDTPWWGAFHHAVDTSIDDQINENWFRDRGEMGRYAIVTGLLGLEMVHSGSTELHPVWAIAIRVEDTDPADEVWAIFVRNVGNEGFCSMDQHNLRLPNNAYTFHFPWRPGASAVSVIPTTIFKGNSSFDYTLQAAPNEGLLLSFSPLAASVVRINGELHLRWTGGRGPAPIPAQLPPSAPVSCEQGCQADCSEFKKGTERHNQCLSNCRKECPAVGDNDEAQEPEKRLAALLATFTPSQRREVASLTPAAPVSHDQKIGRNGGIGIIRSLPRAGNGTVVKSQSEPDVAKRARDQRLLQTIRRIRPG